MSLVGGGRVVLTAGRVRVAGEESNNHWEQSEESEASVAHVCVVVVITHSIRFFARFECVCVCVVCVNLARPSSCPSRAVNIFYLFVYFPWLLHPPLLLLLLPLLLKKIASFVTMLHVSALSLFLSLSLSL